MREQLVMKGDQRRRLPYKQHKRGDHRRGRGDWEADKVALVQVSRLNIEPGQSKRSARHEECRWDDRAKQPTDLAERLDRPRVRQDRRGDPEGHQICQRIELHAEVALAVSKPGDRSVEAIKYQGDEDGRGRPGVVIIIDSNDGVNAAQKVADR